MSTDLEHDLRAAFDELAATTAISPAPRFGDVTAQFDQDPRRSRFVFLAAAAAVIALVGGLALLVRDRTAEAPAPAATTTPVAAPEWFLFPDASSDVRYDDPLAVVDAYLADRMTTSPPGQTVTYTVNSDGPPFGGTEDHALIGFSITVTPDDQTLCCDSADGIAVVALADGAWFVEAAQTRSMRVDSLSYSDEGVVESAYSGMAGGMYTATIDTFGYPGPEENGFSGEQQPLPGPGNNATFRSPAHTAPAVAVRFWHEPTDRWPNPSAAFAEFIIARGTDNAATIVFDPAPPETTAPPIEDGSAPTLLSAASSTPIEAVEGYLVEATEGSATLVDAGLVDDVPAATIASTGRLFRAEVPPNAVVMTQPNEAWVRFELIGSAGTTDGIARVVDTSWATGAQPTWTVSYAGTRGIVLSSATYRDRLVRGEIDDDQVALVLWLESGDGVEMTRMPDGGYEVGLGADAPATVALTAWSLPGAVPAFAEVLLSDGGEHEPVDFGALLDSLFGDGVQTTVPAFVGLTEGQARAAAEQAGLVLDVGITVVPAGDPLDATIASQEMPPGTVTVRGTTVTVTLVEARID